MANTTPQNPPSTPVKQLAFAFPFRRKGQGTGAASADFTDEHEFHKLLSQEPSGAYSVSGKGMWHGGIHVTEAGAGASLDLKSGVRCIADGEVVAWRVNRTYPVSEIPAQNGNPAISAPYSTGFALVRHSMEFPKDRKLTFYSLYAHLQDFADYESDTSLPRPKYWTTRFEVTTHAQDRPTAGAGGQSAPADQQGLRVLVSKPHGTVLGILPQGAQVSIGKREGGWGKIKDASGVTPYPPVAGGFVQPSALVNGWIFLGVENGGPVAKEVMPDSSLDKVVVLSAPSEVVQIKAGELIGHLGRYDSLSQQTSGNRMVHIEVFCDGSVKSFIDKGRDWIKDNGAHLSAWQQLKLPADPTILRIDSQTKLYGLPNQEGADARQTGVIGVFPLAALAKADADHQFMETAVVPGSDGEKRHWWKVDSADVRHQPIDGWVREQSFAGGRVTKEFAQKWVDFQPLDDEHDPTHTMFATTQGFVDYSVGADVPNPGSLDKLSPLMTSIYQALHLAGDQTQAADDLCNAANDPWNALRMSRLIIQHESEWANPDKWKQLIAAIEAHTGPRAEHAEEQKRIEKLVWWDAVKTGLTGFPASNVFHIHPIGLVGNFACEQQLITLDMLVAVEPANSVEHYTSMLPHLNKYAKAYSVNTSKRIAHFLSQCAHETHFRVTEEGLNYNPRNMRKTFGCKGGKNNYNASCDDCTHGRLRDKLWSQESYYANNVEHLANYVYAGRMGNGDESSGDGYKYRGRGLIQITGKSGYQSFQDEHNRRVPDDPKDFIANPELVVSNVEYGVESAYVFWSRNNLNRTSDTETVMDVTQIVNGGQNGYADRLSRYNKVAPILGLSTE
ncbi:putative chitinase [Paraburkholderia sp. RAU2J]|uniref:glycoside hydrolase family 19 protein n=1 Tax=Paraburkholderia sp. RAU2J TaxID=1938810 RepID=UPI000EB2EC2D|nr:glycoside hydrolase family 19 protein [Paraburkholderia sp. RAU2J]RKT13440.1 putative chitinase [Paraburkholderia sp. RAU2J]